MCMHVNFVMMTHAGQWCENDSCQSIMSWWLMPATALSMQVQARPGLCYASCTDSCCAGMHRSNKQWGYPILTTNCMCWFCLARGASPASPLAELHFWWVHSTNGWQHRTAAQREQGQHYIGFRVNPRYSAVSRISYMRHHSWPYGMNCSILKLLCMLVHDTHKRTCALPVHKDCWVSEWNDWSWLCGTSSTHSHCMLIQLPSIQLRVLEFLRWACQQSLCRLSAGCGEKLSKAVPALKHLSDALCDWADDYEADISTTEVSLLKCSHDAQRSHVCVHMCVAKRTCYWSQYQVVLMMQMSNSGWKRHRLRLHLRLINMFTQLCF